MITGRAVIVTLPMMVLREGPTFSPPLPNATRAAIDGFTSGIYEHAVLHWPSSPFTGRDRLAGIAGAAAPPPGLLTRIDGTPFHFYDELDTGRPRSSTGSAGATTPCGGTSARSLPRPSAGHACTT